MPKGICATIAAVALVAASFGLHAQVYRCETPSGVTYSDMPCGDSSEEIAIEGVVMDTMGVGGGDPAAVQAETGVPRRAASRSSSRNNAAVSAPAARAETAPPGEGVSDAQYLTDFLAMLRTQREQQMGEIDSQLQALRRRAESGGDSPAENANRDELLNQIAALESNRDSIIAEYEALIAEAEARLE